MEQALARARETAGASSSCRTSPVAIPGWEDAVRAAAAAGADGIEIGIPFSDPVMDGPVIQQASQAALDAGANPPAILDAVAGLDVGIPLAVMTYYNLVHHDGHRRFAGRLVAAGVDACILPDLPLEESGPWCRAADEAGRRDGHAGRADRARRAAAPDRRPGPRLRLLRRAARRDGGAGGARRHGHRARRAAQGDHRPARARRRRGVQRRAGRARRARSPTASSRARPSSAG